MGRIYKFILLMCLFQGRWLKQISAFLLFTLVQMCFYVTRQVFRVDKAVKSVEKNYEARDIAKLGVCLFSVVSSVSFIDPVAIVIEGDLHEYRCNASDGASSAVSMQWSLDGLPLAECQNIPVDMSCVVHVTRTMHGKTVHCEEVRLDGETDGFDELRFEVMCKF